MERRERRRDREHVPPRTLDAADRAADACVLEAPLAVDDQGCDVPTRLPGSDGAAGQMRWCRTESWLGRWILPECRCSPHRWVHINGRRLALR